MESGKKIGHTDIRMDYWILRLSPPWLRPYLRLARLDRPIGTLLLMWPCWWSIALASEGWPSPVLLVLFAVGALVMRGAGCCWNDISDRDFDGKVERTQGRPLPAGEITVRQGIIFMGVLCLIGLAILISFNPFAILVGVASLVTVLVYPFMKRVTWWPQFFLGLAFNWGALLGWAAVRGDLGLPPLLLYIGGIAWTLGYDTIYAHQDKEDDMQIGIKSTALLLKGETRKWLWYFFMTALILFGAAGLAAGLHEWFLIGFILAALHVVWQVLALDIEDPVDCLKKFQANNWLGLIIFLCFVAGAVLPVN